MSKPKDFDSWTPERQEEWRIRQRVRCAKYLSSPKGKAAIAKYRASPKGKAKRAKYEASPKGKAKRAEYEASPNGKAKRAEYEASPNGKAKQARYNASPKGKATIVKAHAKKLESLRDDYIASNLKIPVALLRMHPKGPDIIAAKRELIAAKRQLSPKKPKKQKYASEPTIVEGSP